ncbi:MAG: ATP-dependent metallopeptidase FtsH/Yme1/Tma family protein, partial [Firmicutes bacterium]|nr:ATP-dependent metallopeptidase FtsH/Yme1/Tma family protein [Bacillota bacterium]
MNRVFKNFSIYLLIILIVVAIMRYAATEPTNVKPLTYDKFIDALEQGRVKSVTIQTDRLTNIINGKYADNTKFSLYGPVQDDQLIQKLLEKDVEYEQ